MFDINEIMKRAQQAKEQALDSVKEAVEKTERRINEIEVLKKAHLHLPPKLKIGLPLTRSVKWTFLGRHLGQAVWLKWQSMGKCCKRW